MSIHNNVYRGLPKHSNSGFCDFAHSCSQGLVKVNRVPFIKMNRLFAHSYRVLVTPKMYALTTWIEKSLLLVSWHGRQLVNAVLVANGREARVLIPVGHHVFGYKSSLPEIICGIHCMKHCQMPKNHIENSIFRREPGLFCYVLKSWLSSFMIDSRYSI